MYDQPHSGLHTFDFVVSSYTPSLSAPLRYHEDSQLSDPSMLLVAQPEAVRDLDPLPSVRQESDVLRALFPGDGHTFLENERGTVENMLAALDERSWLSTHSGSDAECVRAL